MKNIFRNFPIHCQLIIPALIFFLYVHNYDSTSFASTLRSYAISFAVSLFLFLVLFFLLRKDKHKAGVVTTSLMLILFSYGVIYEVAEKLFYRGLWPFDEIHRYLVTGIVLLIAALCYFLFRTKRTFKSLTLSLNIFVIVLFIINTAQLASAATHRKNEIADIEKKQSLAHDSLPDIYYIILDGYANDSVLASFYNYSPNTLTTFLSENDFYIASESRTNYISTKPSLSSSLNYNYLDTLYSWGVEPGNEISRNKVSERLKEKGYKVVHIRSGYAVTRENYLADTIIALNNLGEFERTMLKYTIFRLDDLLGYVRHLTLKEQLGAIYSAIKVKGPKFTFLHIVSPHPPYTCDEDGNFKTSPRIVNVWWEPKKDYIMQLKYINCEVIKFISEIFKNSNKKPIIIIQADHGPWMQSSSLADISEARSRILNSYFIPFEWKSRLYKSITPVNSFRIIFNGLFNDSLPIIKDIPLDSITVKNNMNSNLLETE